MYFYVSSFKDAFIDDAYITFQYARNLRDHQNWGFLPDKTTNTATSPLNILLTAGISLVIEDIVKAAIWLAAFESLLLFWLLLAISNHQFQNNYFGFVGFLATMANPILVSTFGLETLLYLVLVIASVYSFLKKRWFFLGINLALLTLTRPDGILLFLIFLVIIWRLKDLGRRQILLFLVPYIFILLPWYTFSWIHLGSFLPDTFFIKVNSNWGGMHYLTGIGLYLFRYPISTLLSFVFVPIGFVYLLKQRRGIPMGALIFFIFGTLYFGSYSLLRVPPYHWYYTPVAVTLNLTGIYALSTAYINSKNRHNYHQHIIFGATSIVAVLGVLFAFLSSPGFHITEPPIHTNWATNEQYREIGLWLYENTDKTQKIKLEGEIGTLAYYSQRQLIDIFSCRYEQQLNINNLLQRGGLIAYLARINFYWFDPGDPCWPQAYRLTFTTPGEYHSDPSEAQIKSWQISTKWIPEGQLVLLEFLGY